jgi:hypothetical protein
LENNLIQSVNITYESKHSFLTRVIKNAVIDFFAHTSDM